MILSWDAQFIEKLEQIIKHCLSYIEVLQQAAQTRQKRDVGGRQNVPDDLVLRLNKINPSESHRLTNNQSSCITGILIL